MLFGNFGSSSGPPAFTRPTEAQPNFMPKGLRTGFVPEYEPYPMIMRPRMARTPKGIALPAASEPGNPAPAAPTNMLAEAPNGLPSPVKVKAQRMIPPHLVMAMGILPFGRNIKASRSPDGLVATGRKPSL